MASRSMKRPRIPVFKTPPGVTITTEEHFAADLKVDAGTVQRYFEPRHANRLASKWNPLMVGTILVSRRADGSLYIIDGQHRNMVALRLDPTAVMRCEVYEGLSIKDEAEMFLHFNKGRKAPSVYSSFLVELTAEDPTAFRMQSQVRSCGLELAESPSPKKVAAIQKCRQIVELDKAETGLLQDTLRVCEMAWGRRADSWDGQIIWGVAQVIHRNRSNIDLDRLARVVLGKQMPYRWKAEVQSLLGHSGGSSSRSNPLISLTAEAYNKRLRDESRKIEQPKRSMRRK
jgi:hypothetical protein